MRLTVSSKLNPILLATIRFTVCGIPTNVYKSMGIYYFHNISLFLKPVPTILDGSSFRRLADFFLSCMYPERKTKITATQKKTDCPHKIQLHNNNYFFYYFKS